MKLIIAGGRNYQLTEHDYGLLDEIHALHCVELVLSGGATGADLCGERWALSNGIPVDLHKADWKQYGRAAGPIRNERMAELADAVALFPGGRGTANMRVNAKRRGLMIFDFVKIGKVTE